MSQQNPKHIEPPENTEDATEVLRVWIKNNRGVTALCNPAPVETLEEWGYILSLVIGAVASIVENEEEQERMKDVIAMHILAHLHRSDGTDLPGPDDAEPSGTVH